MKYIYCQLLALIREEYSENEIMDELKINVEDISSYVYNHDWKPENIFDREELNQWHRDTGYGLEGENEDEE